jgi:hypothetical protein
MSRSELRSAEFAWRNGVKPTRIAPRHTPTATSLYARAYEKARCALLQHGQSIGPMSTGGAR